MNSKPNALVLHHFPLSGHAHRARLMLSLLGLPHEIRHVELAAGEHRQPAFLAINAFGQVPVLQDGDYTLADSNAILVYLALHHDPSRRWLPEDHRRQGEVQRWLGAAAGPALQGPGAARIAHVFKRPLDPAVPERARQFLATLEQHLSDRTWLVGDHATIADVANYSYVAHAPEGGIALEPYPALRAWLQRIEALPGFVGMPRSPVPA